MFDVVLPRAREALPVREVSRSIDHVEVTFDEPNLVANAGLLLVGTLVVRLELERLVNSMVRLGAGWVAPVRAANC